MDKMYLIILMAVISALGMSCNGCHRNNFAKPDPILKSFDSIENALQKQMDKPGNDSLPKQGVGAVSGDTFIFP